MSRLEGKVAVITGGASGIGAGIVARFAEEGAQVLLTDVQAEKGHALAEANGALFMRQDVREPDQWERVLDHAVSEFGRLDILVNNAGIVGGGPIDEGSLDDFERVIGVNLTGTFLGCQKAIARMRQNPGGPGGVLINISSTTGFVGLAGDAAYTASKAAVRMMSKSIAVHCARQGWNIRCNSVHPGAIDTPIMEPARAAAGRETFDQILASMSPMGRMGTPWDVAGGCLYLASDDAAFVTGTELLIDGGSLATQPGL